ncbi:MAG: G1 family glutamic endopeptidase [Conexivisphaera sp.]
MPGDLIVAWVQYNSNNGTFTTVLKDVAEGWTHVSPATSIPGADRSSAEWIVERPAIGGSLTTLANFGTAEFGL